MSPREEKIDGIIKMFQNNNVSGQSTITDEVLKIYSGKTKRLIYRMVNKGREQESVSN